MEKWTRTLIWRRGSMHTPSLCCPLGAAWSSSRCQRLARIKPLSYLAPSALLCLALAALSLSLHSREGACESAIKTNEMVALTTAVPSATLDHSLIFSLDPSTAHQHKYILYYPLHSTSTSAQSSTVQPSMDLNITSFLQPRF